MSEMLDCLNELINDVRLHAQIYEMSYVEAYFDKINTILTENGDVLELTYSECRELKDEKNRTMRADGYSFNVEDGADASNIKELTLVVADYQYDEIVGDIDNIKTINTSDLEKKFVEMKRFIEGCSSPGLLNQIAETAEYFGLVQLLTNNFQKLEKINILYATTSRFSGRIKEFEAEDILGIKINKQVYDLSRHCAIMASKDGSEPTLIEFEEHGFRPLPALKTTDSGNTQSLLLAVPGDLLFRIYEEHGARLLEQNVRTYLQARGNVNKGMIATLRENPERFFAYNNGLTATASEIIFEPNSSTTLSISGIKNLQIVNGGQTTASIHYAKFKTGADLSKVFVQMKLSVVDPELLEAIVPKIAQYANTQNKVNAADFFANHPFHRQFEILSRANSTPKQDNAISSFGTHWYYERARGAYNNETYKLRTAAAKKEFANKYPKSQLILKTDLAKYLMSFEGHPDLVSKGAQTAFVQHANKIGLPEDFNKKINNYNEVFFKEAIAKTIMFREVDKIVQKADWYEGGGSKACTVTYTIAWFARELKTKGHLLDFQKIWKCQSLTPELEQIFIGLSPKIYQFLKDTTPENLSAVPQWAKQKRCWDGVKDRFSCDLDMELLEATLTTKELQKEDVKIAKKKQKEYNKDMHYVAMVHIKATTWSAIKQFSVKHEIYKALTPNQQRDLNRLANSSDGQLMRQFISEKEAVNLMPLFGELDSLGFDFHAYSVDACLYS